MIKKLTPVLLALLCIYLDSILFGLVNFLDVRPDAMLAATVSYSILAGPFPGALFGALGGLFLDVIANRYLGLSAALYLAAGISAGFFYKKFYSDNIIVPALSAVALGILKELALALTAIAAGARFAFAGILLRYILPCSLLSGLLCAVMHLALKPLLARQLKRGAAERL